MAIRSTEAASSGTDQEWRKPGLVTGGFGQHHVPGSGSPIAGSSPPSGSST